MSVELAATTLVSILVCNVWLMAGSLVLSLAIDRGRVRRPRQVVHAVVLMAIWPWLLMLRNRRSIVKNLAA